MLQSLWIKWLDWTGAPRAKWSLRNKLLDWCSKSKLTEVTMIQAAGAFHLILDRVCWCGLRWQGNQRWVKLWNHRWKEIQKVKTMITSPLCSNSLQGGMIYHHQTQPTKGGLSHINCPVLTTLKLPLFPTIMRSAEWIDAHEWYHFLSHWTYRSFSHNTVQL